MAPLSVATFFTMVTNPVHLGIEALINGSGPLLDEYKATCNTTVYRSLTKLLDILPQRIKEALQPLVGKLEALYINALLMGRRYNLIYANTGATWQQVDLLSKFTPTLLWHIHELEYGLRVSIGQENIEQAFEEISRFIAVSISVQDTLTREFNVPHEKIDLIHGFVPVPNLTLEEHQARCQRVKNGLGWAQDVFVVGGCGSLGWRKGTDLFLQIACLVSRKKGYEKVRFLWVGGGKQDNASLEFDHDVRALGLQEVCSRIITTEEVSDYYCAMDVFALTSREDPFPLVMLEAGTYNAPTICFEGSGGGAEFVGDNAGLTAPYLDIVTFAAHIMTLHDQSDLCAQFGNAASEKVRTYFTIDCQGPKLRQSIEFCLAEAKNAPRATLKR